MVWLGLEGNSNSQASLAFLKQLPKELEDNHPGPWKSIWDNVAAHRGEAMRECLGTPGLELQLEYLPGYSPYFNPDEVIRGWPGRKPPATSARGADSSAGNGRKIPGWANPPERRGETALPDSPAIQGRDVTPKLQASSRLLGKCTSHPGFGFERQSVRPQVVVQLSDEFSLLDRM